MGEISESGRFTCSYVFISSHLTASLLATGSTEIAEASAYDSLFGIGLSLNSPDAVVKAKWKGSNIQGAALTQVRDSIKSINATL